MITEVGISFLLNIGTPTVAATLAMIFSLQLTFASGANHNGA